MEVSFDTPVYPSNRSSRRQSVTWLSRTSIEKVDPVVTVDSSFSVSDELTMGTLNSLDSVQLPSNVKDKIKDL